jgi:hypothetical protein
VVAGLDPPAPPLAPVVDPLTPPLLFEAAVAVAAAVVD